MPRRPDTTFRIPGPPRSETTRTEGGRLRPLSAAEALERREAVERAAEAGDPEARVELARRLLSEATHWTHSRRARRLLDRVLDNPAARTSKVRARALYLKGLTLLRGQGVPRDLEAGARAVEEAAWAGVTEAEVDAARLACLGLGRTVSLEDALYWWRLAAATGNLEAQRETGRAYRDGLGTAVDFAQAARWLGLAAEKGDSAAQYESALLQLRRDNPDRDPAAARRWMKEAALSGNVDAQYRLGLFYWSGTGGSVNLRLAVRWLTRAAEGESARAAATLAGLFLTGNVFELNRLHAWILLQRAKALGDPTADATALGLKDLLDPRERSEGRKLLKRYPDTKSLLEALLPKNWKR